MDNVERARRLVDSSEILDGHTDTENAKEIVRRLLEEIERLKERVPKKGAWIFTGQKNAYGGIVIECPFCEDKYAVATPLSEHFCRNCGAKLMD